MKRLMFLVVAMLLLVAACGEGQKVGNEKLLDFEEQEGAEALGREPDATEAPLALDQATPTPVRATPTPRPEATPVFFDIALVTDHPYYSPGNCWVIPVGVTVRVTNKDTIPERKDGRTFTGPPGTFHSGVIKPNGQWTWVFDGPGSYPISDEKLQFATGATLHVGQGSC